MVSENGPNFSKAILAVLVIVIALGLFSFFLIPYQGTEDGISDEDKELYSQALLENDPDLCDQISSEDLRNSCTETLTPSDGGEDRLTEQEVSDRRYYNDALLNGNITLCDRISDEDMRNSCIIDLTPEPGEDDPQERADLENFEQALLEFDSSYCDLIVDDDIRNSCHEIVGY